MNVHKVKSQFSLDTHKSDQSLLCAQWATKYPNFLHVDSEYSDQTELIARPIRVFSCRIAIFSVFSIKEIL